MIDLALLEDGFITADDCVKIEVDKDEAFEEGQLRIDESDCGTSEKRKILLPACNPFKPAVPASTAPSESPATSKTASSLAFHLKKGVSGNEITVIEATKPSTSDERPFKKGQSRRKKNDLCLQSCSVELVPWYPTTFESTLSQIPYAVVQGTGGSRVKAFRARGLNNTVWACIYEKNIHGPSLDHYLRIPQKHRYYVPKLYEVQAMHVYSGSMMRELPVSLLSYNFNQTVTMIGFAAPVIMAAPPVTVLGSSKMESYASLKLMNSIMDNAIQAQRFNPEKRTTTPAVISPSESGVSAPQTTTKIISQAPSLLPKSDTTRLNVHQPPATPSQIVGDLPVVMSRRPIDHGIDILLKAMTTPQPGELDAHAQMERARLSAEPACYHLNEIQLREGYTRTYLSMYGAKPSLAETYLGFYLRKFAESSNLAFRHFSRNPILDVQINAQQFFAHCPRSNMNVAGRPRTWNHTGCFFPNTGQDRAGNLIITKLFIWVSVNLQFSKKL